MSPRLHLRLRKILDHLHNRVSIFFCCCPALSLRILLFAQPFHIRGTSFDHILISGIHTVLIQRFLRRIGFQVLDLCPNPSSHIRETVSLHAVSGGSDPRKILLLNLRVSAILQPCRLLHGLDERHLRPHTLCFCFLTVNLCKGFDIFRSAFSEDF